ncbi:TIM44-like domain-containing protein [Pseudodesulfovibrio cashew]|nr:TIM44-like domain-containing protein [Pseudodesulfovibrio cashew]
MGGGDKDNTRPGQWTRQDKGESGTESGGKVLRPMDRYDAARQMWGHLSSEKSSDESAAPSPVAASGQIGFDENEFLEGAKLFFSRFQQANSEKEIEDLRVFLSDEVYANAVLKAQQFPDERIEVMLVDARLMELKSEGGQTLATVFYDAQISRGESGGQPGHVRAVWEFSRDDDVENGLWTLEKINKVDQ